MEYIVETNWKDFWKNYWHLSKKAETEESTAANIIACLIYFFGFGLFFYGAANYIIWMVVTGIICLVIGSIIFRVNTALAHCKVAEEEIKNHP